MRILIIIEKHYLIKEDAYFDEQDKADSEVENDEETSDDSSDEESLADQRQEEDKVKIREYYKEDAVDPQDTLLIDVKQANIDEKSVTNCMAETIIQKERDIFYSDDEELYYSDDEINKEEDDVLEDEPSIKKNEGAKALKLIQIGNKMMNVRNHRRKIFPSSKKLKLSLVI